ncbi:putative ATP synthase D chain, mitochondrial [Peziza echinospora]|nr:putative ATP synthase D chain, mitochondrial [Peziza echinospora]
MSVARSAALKIDWTRIATSLNLKGSTVTSLQAFKKRNEDVRRKNTLLSEQPQTIDFAHYRSILNNQAIVNEIEAAAAKFKPVTYDVSKQLAEIEKFEAVAIQNAEQTKLGVDAELQDLARTLENIESARSFDELTVDDVAKARPDIDARTAEMVSKGRWMPAGYKEKFGDLSLL